MCSPSDTKNLYLSKAVGFIPRPFVFYGRVRLTRQVLTLPGRKARRARIGGFDDGQAKNNSPGRTKRKIRNNDLGGSNGAVFGQSEN